jgi:hypothetical protein
MLVPRTRFGSSVYNVPLLLALRFFYHASPFEAATKAAHDTKNEEQIAHFTSQGGLRNLSPVPIDLSAAKIPAPPPTPRPPIPPSNTNAITSSFSTAAYLHHLLSSPKLQHHPLHSLTWTKSLSSPLSHEFLQFITSDPLTNLRSRHLTHRHADGGDTVLLNHDFASPSQLTDLPLPLLSLTFSDSESRPTALSLAHLLHAITRNSPRYSLLREMCWWHAETVFEAAHEQWGGRITEWEFAHLRYSFVVRGGVLRRERLVKAAEGWRGECVRGWEF